MAASLAACGGASGGGGGGGNCSGGSSRVEVVVELGNHQVLDRCVGFTGAQVAAETALHDSGIEYAIQQFSFGDAVCQVDHEPTSYSDCFGSGQPYWSLFLWSGKGPWKTAETGVSDVTLKAGDAMGWRYEPAQGSAPPPPAPPAA
jgi:hypothetical protein